MKLNVTYFMSMSPMSPEIVIFDIGEVARFSISKESFRTLKADISKVTIVRNFSIPRLSRVGLPGSLIIFGESEEYIVHLTKPSLLGQISLGKLAICHNLQKMWLYIHRKIA